MQPFKSTNIQNKMSLQLNIHFVGKAGGGRIKVPAGIRTEKVLNVLISVY